METRKLSPEEILDALDEQETDDEIERVLALGPEELDRELRALGADPQAVRAGAAPAFERAMQRRAESIAERSAEKEPVAHPKVVALRPRRRIVWLSAASVAAACAGVLGVRAVTLVGLAAANRHEHALELRREAVAACHEARWGECLSKLDGARALDPDGENTEEVRSMRTQIDAAHPRPSP